MSIYRTYALKLNDAYKTAFGEFKTLYDAMIDAEKNKDAVFRSLAAYNDNAEADFKRREAARKANIARDNFNNRCTAIWREFNEQRSAIRAEVEAAVHAHNVASPESVDPNGLELLKSGILTPADMQVLAKRYADNPTMKRLVGKYAEEAAYNSTDARARSGYTVICQEIKKNDVMAKWETLDELAEVSGGSYNSRLTYPNQVLSMGQQWDGLFSQLLNE